MRDWETYRAAAKAERERLEAWGRVIYAMPPAERPYGQRGRYPKPPYYPKNAAGVKPCRWCMKPTQRNWCGPECVAEFMRRAHWPTMARFIKKRDQTCRLCGGQRPHVSEARPVYAGYIGDDCEGWPIEGGWDGAAADAEAGLPDRRPQACRIEYTFAVDHILAVKEGGTDDPENLRLLCGRCHDEVSADQAARWAAERREGRAALAGQQALL